VEQVKSTASGFLFRFLMLNGKSVTLLAETEASRSEWVRALSTVVFKTKNIGDMVKVRSVLSFCARV
jgi:hypothetical protein